MPRRRGQEAAYQQVAQGLRAQIDAGQLLPGMPLPTEPQLEQQFGVSRITVRRAVQILRDEGRVETRHGSGSYVTPPRSRRRLSMQRYADPRPPEAGATIDREFDEVDAEGDVAAALQVQDGTLLLRRRMVQRLNHSPQKISTSYLLADMVAGTPLADPAYEPWEAWTIAQLADLGVKVTAVEESVLGRRPTAEEMQTLTLQGSDPVQSITRRMLAGDRPVEAAVDIVVPADRFFLDYRIDLP
ncbi:GntR family transcriptional regulator [Catenuloplanes indicus]|nr:GntR family transcriptional regulator [Catenuloplanes indicus]